MTFSDLDGKLYFQDEKLLPLSVSRALNPMPNAPTADPSSRSPGLWPETRL